MWHSFSGPDGWEFLLTMFFAFKGNFFSFFYMQFLQGSNLINMNLSHTGIT